MPERAVYRTSKDEWGNIVALGGEFGVVSHLEALADIEAGAEHYFVALNDGSGVPVEVLDGPLGKYLRANWDGQGRNNLVDLPDV